MPWNVIENGRNIPSTFQQVIENMRYIQDTILPKIDILNDTVFNPDNTSNKSDMVVDENEILRVVGVTIVTENRDKDTLPGEYLRNVTYELKETAVVGLTGKNGITLDHVLIKTIHMGDDAAGVEYPTWQAAYGDIEMTTYFRKALSSTEWDEWVAVMNLREIIESNEELLEKISHRQFVSSLTEPGPDEQEVGDYWMQTLVTDIETTGYFFQSIDDETKVTPITAETRLDYAFDSLEDDTDTLDKVEEDDEFKFDSSAEVPAQAGEPSNT